MRFSAVPEVKVFLWLFSFALPLLARAPALALASLPTSGLHCFVSPYLDTYPDTLTDTRAGG